MSGEEDETRSLCSRRVLRAQSFAALSLSFCRVASTIHVLILDGEREREREREINAGNVPAHLEKTQTTGTELRINQLASVNVKAFYKIGYTFFSLSIPSLTWNRVIPYNETDDVNNTFLLNDDEELSPTVDTVNLIQNPDMTVSVAANGTLVDEQLVTDDYIVETFKYIKVGICVTPCT